MMTLPRLAAESLEKVLGSFMRRRYDETYARYQSTEFPSKMSDNQRRAMFIATVAIEAIDKYRLNKLIKRRNGIKNEIEATEFERIELDFSQ